MDDAFPLPTNPDAERFVLGSILLDDSYFSEVAAAIEVGTFSLDKHQRIYRRMKAIADRGERIDRVTVANELLKHEELSACDGLSYLISLDDGLPANPKLDSYVRILRDYATLRRIVFASQNLIGSACQPNADPAALLQQASGQFLSLADAPGDDELQTPYEIIEEEVGRVGIKAFFDGGSKGIQTPIRWLNETIIGLHPGDLILIGARPSVGKTALALQVAQVAAKAGNGVLFFSREMGKLPLSLRLACCAANVDSQLLRGGICNAEERERLMEAHADMKELPLWIDKNSGTIEAIHAKIRRARTRVKVDLAIVDYIQLMATDARTQNQNAAVSAISRGLKLAAEEFRIPIVALSQLSRPPKGTNPVPTLADLRDSGSLEQDADVVIFLHSADGKLGTGIRRLIVDKQRNGPVDATNVMFAGQFQRFSEMAQEPEGEY